MWKRYDACPGCRLERGLVQFRFQQREYFVGTRLATRSLQHVPDECLYRMRFALAVVSYDVGIGVDGFLDNLLKDDVITQGSMPSFLLSLVLACIVSQVFG
jgi:hypothetical protein